MGPSKHVKVGGEKAIPLVEVKRLKKLTLRELNVKSLSLMPEHENIKSENLILILAVLDFFF